jgi:hypothetical protein
MLHQCQLWWGSVGQARMLHLEGDCPLEDRRKVIAPQSSA